MDTNKSVTIDHSKCPPCERQSCMGVCPQGILEPNKEGKPVATDQALCTRCEVCADLCPNKAITVSKS